MGARELPEKLGGERRVHGCRWALSARAGELDLGRGLNARVVNVFLARRDLGALLQGATKLKYRKGYRTRRLGM